jgi:hypothetical protein
LIHHPFRECPVFWVDGDGTFDVTATLTDSAGNASVSSSATSVTVDTTAPAATIAITAIDTDIVKHQR